MSSILQQLNNESILLLYLAGELSAADRADVEQTLAGDPKLREQLETLRAAYDGAGEALAAADASERLALPAASAARRVGNAVRSWHARRLVAPPARDARRNLRFPWWCYVAASVAGLIIIAVGLWGMIGDHGPTYLPSDQVTNLNLPEDDGPSSAPSEDVAATDTPFDGETYSLTLHDESDAALDEAEEELLALSQRADDGSGIMLLIGETDER